MRIILLLLLLLLLFSLTLEGCGLKGPLYLPTTPQNQTK